jgi:hypothetical protein
LDVSSKGLAFHVGGPPLENGTRLKASMDWPAALDEKCKLRLVFEGTVLRTLGHFTVVSIERPEFHTAGRTTG